MLADNRKLRQRSAMIVTDLSRISTLITDSDATGEQLKPFLEAGIRVIQVDARAAFESASHAVGS